MTKQLENGDLSRVHVWINTSDWKMLKKLARIGSRDQSALSASEILRELVTTALRGLRPGQIVAYDRVLQRDMQLAQRHLDKALKRINIPKQGSLTKLRPSP